MVIADNTLQVNAPNAQLDITWALRGDVYQ